MRRFMQKIIQRSKPRKLFKGDAPHRNRSLNATLRTSRPLGTFRRIVRRTYYIRGCRDLLFPLFPHGWLLVFGDAINGLCPDEIAMLHVHSAIQLKNVFPHLIKCSRIFDLSARFGQKLIGLSLLYLPNELGEGSQFLPLLWHAHQRCRQRYPRKSHVSLTIAVGSKSRDPLPAVTTSKAY
jgi:hypothetical protein